MHLAVGRDELTALHHRLRYLKRLAARERQVALSEAEQMRQKVQLSVLAMKRKTFALSNTGGA